MDKKRGEDSKHALKQTLKKKINYLLNKQNLDAVTVYNLIKKFFQAYTGNNYEYTREELVEVMNKFYMKEDVKESLKRMVLELGEVEFSHPTFSKDQLHSMLKEFERSVDEIVHPEAKKNMGFWDKVSVKLKRKVKKEEEQEEEEEKNPLESFLTEADGQISSFEFDDSAEEIEDVSTVPEPSDFDDGTIPAPSRHEVPHDVFSEDMDAVPEPKDNQEAPSKSQKPAQEQAMQTAPEQDFSQPATLSGQEKEFDKELQAFYDDLYSDNVDMARLSYEEVKHTYEGMDDDAKQRNYKKLQKAYDDLTQML